MPVRLMSETPDGLKLDVQVVPVVSYCSSADYSWGNESLDHMKVNGHVDPPKFLQVAHFGPGGTSGIR